MSDQEETPDTDSTVDPAELNKRVDALIEELNDYKASAARDSRFLWAALAVVLLSGIGVLILNDMFPHKPQATTRDDTAEALLTPGVHCFNSPEEMAATRQRALAAIDEINWEISKPTSTKAVPYPVFQIDQPDPPNVPPRPPHVVDATQPGLKKLDDRDVDNATCFGISTPDA